MKKYILLTVNILILTALFAQKPSLTKAYNFFYDKDYDKAKVQIDLCTADEKLSTKAQTWLYKGNIVNAGVSSPYSLYDEEVATFEADEVFDQKDADGFINLYGLSSKVYAMMRRKNGLPLC